EMYTLSPRLNGSQVLPHFIASETHDRSQQPDHCLANPPQSGLRRAPSHRVRREGIKPVLGDVGVERAQLNRAEMIHALINLMERKLLVPSLYVRRQSSSHAKNVLIDGLHLLE